MIDLGFVQIPGGVISMVQGGLWLFWIYGNTGDKAPDKRTIHAVCASALFMLGLVAYAAHMTEGRIIEACQTVIEGLGK